MKKQLTKSGQEKSYARARAWAKRMGHKWLYQFEAGHWASASADSPVGQSLETTNYIYPTIASKAIKNINLWEK